ncbi:hypothetical protein LCGC14_0382780 [marine sediment metagenome]|uniref:Uncharacterized protein n=1 Tax=marine sediment metagenome TaxID=412755 RepID=A0A0F9T7Z7_9ZZZZ
MIDIIRGAGGIRGPVRKTITYAAGGTGANATETDIFTVTGDVIVVALVAFCTTNLDQSAGTPTLELGVNNDTNLFVAATTATAIDADDFWVDASPTEVGGVALPAAFKDIVVTDNISCTVGGTNNISAGVIEYTVYWLPISSNGNVVAN